MATTNDKQPEDIWNALRQVYDPELQFSIVELGLVYGVERLSDGRVKVTMTLTSPACPYGPALVDEVKAALMMLPGVAGVEVNVVWDPPWGPEKMSEAARLALGFDV